ncbi:SDR family NAD(P)-dependent oxidoreductase [Kosakonia cowanii]|uniref:SDR family NAD(P)-dependent oxidoreductase n=1 Tax=Kosakonia cowanii TaxID=208223 RepID=UPI0023F7A132|nr:SDR family NAD(P)-dependent oxidoreductase [Kosakonia cowanii]MDF7761106.1 SDR family NAD(P)-dependent oxidoreductase [Kosakonia cowanii]
MYTYKDLNSKNVLISGASGDIGLAICEKYLDQGCNVYALFKNNVEPLRLLSESHDHGHRLTTFQCDLANPENVSELVIYLNNAISRLDVLINNAGIVKDNLFSSMSFEDFNVVIETNMLSTFQLTKAMLKFLRGAEGATIVNVASIAGIIASVGQANYSASKGALLGFTRTLAAELAPRGIRVNAVAPGMIASKMVKKVSRTVVRDVTNSIPLKRLGNCNEVANAIVWLSSSASSYIVGQTIVVDGGLVMR